MKEIDNIKKLRKTHPWHAKILMLQYTNHLCDLI